MGLKTKRMSNIFQPIDFQLQRLKILSSNDHIKAADVTRVQSIIFEQLNGLAEKFAHLTEEEEEEAGDYREMKKKITNLIQEFCITKNIKEMVKSSRYRDNDDILDVVSDKLMSSLENLENLECAPLERQLRQSRDYVREMSVAEEIEHFQNIKELGAFVVEIFKPLECYRKNLISPLLAERMALYTCQMCSAFGMLVEVIREQHRLSAPIYSAKKYACERLCWCFEMIIRVLEASSPSDEQENHEKENHFVYRMDLVLDIITSMPGKRRERQLEICKELWSGIEDVFSHAMAIAQVCQPYNFKAITGASQSIMSEYENLKSQLESEKSDPTLNNLFMNTLNDALYRLERKVNISVLTLVMEVFSDPFGTLKKLVKTCGNPLNARKRARSDLDDYIEDFDQITDKAMQIGAFAVACCNDLDRVTKIRHCMASLESLESELVPATIAFYLHPDDKEMRACLKILTTKWQLEMNKLHNVVDLVIDSAAYCQVILDDLQDRIIAMSNSLDKRRGVTKLDVQGVVQRAIALATQITATVDDIGREKIDRQTIMMTRELKTAIYEADAASKSLLVENSTDSQQLRVIKRCKLILNVVKRLQPALVTVMNSSIPTSSGYGKAGMGQGDSLRVKNYKPRLSIQAANGSAPPAAPTDLSSLIPYIKRGRELRMERSIMYKTPKNSEIRDTATRRNELHARNLSSVRQHLFSRDSFVSRSEIDLSNESLDLTAILEKLTYLSDTLGSSVESNDPPRLDSVDTENPRRDSTSDSNVPLARFNDTKAEERSAFGGGDAPSSITTPERVQDIQRIDQKIEILQKQFKSFVID